MRRASEVTCNSLLGTLLRGGAVLPALKLTDELRARRPEEGWQNFGKCLTYVFISYSNTTRLRSTLKVLYRRFAGVDFLELDVESRA